MYEVKTMYTLCKYFHLMVQFLCLRRTCAELFLRVYSPKFCRKVGVFCYVFQSSFVKLSIIASTVASAVGVVYPELPPPTVQQL